MGADRGAPTRHDDPGPAGQAPECQICPLCTALAMLRGTRPEAVEHLAKAGAELLLAAKALLEGAAGPERQPTPRRSRGRAAGGAAPASDGLQRIDIG